MSASGLGYTLCGNPCFSCGSLCWTEVWVYLPGSGHSLWLWRTLLRPRAAMCSTTELYLSPQPPPEPELWMKCVWISLGPSACGRHNLLRWERKQPQQSLKLLFQMSIGTKNACVVGSQCGFHHAWDSVGCACFALCISCLSCLVCLCLEQGPSAQERWSN